MLHVACAGKRKPSALRAPVGRRKRQPKERHAKLSTSNFGPNTIRESARFGREPEGGYTAKRTKSSGSCERETKNYEPLFPEPLSVR
jgi:hypothetical protein